MRQIWSKFLSALLVLLFSLQLGWAQQAVELYQHSSSVNGPTTILPIDGANPLPAIVQPKTATFQFPGCTVAGSSGQCLASGLAVNHVTIQNTSGTASVACAWGVAAVLNSSSSVQLGPSGTATWGPATGGVPTGVALNCIATAGSTPLYLEYN